MSELPRVLVTGAAGLVGGILRAHWRDRYALRLADLRPIRAPDPADTLVEPEPGATGAHEVVAMDVTAYADVRRACEGIDTVVHLAADARTDAEFHETLLPLNVIGAYNAFQAAHEAGCRRIVFASSVNVVFGYAGRTPVSWDVPPHPVNVYGATKCWGEALARVYAHSGLSCLCVRLGNPSFRQWGDWDPEAPSWGISPRDTAQLFARCIEAPEVDFAVVHGVSRHRHPWMRLDEARALLGYEPEDGTALPRQSPPDAG